ALISANNKKTAKELSDLISLSVFEFLEKDKPKDDITYFIMEALE
ncbi:MAG: hypothetical protein GX660_09300, partial [Clostridiaceae bacterium]|nr:hypothetical protein [Clostridiaceae bacterium]